MDADDLDKLDEIMSEMVRQTSMSLAEMAPIINHMITTLAENISKAMEMMTVPLSEFLEAYREALSKAPNNWLKMHGYPMRRKYGRRHSR